MGKRDWYVENLETELRRLGKMLEHTRARMHSVALEIRKRDRPAIDAYAESTRHLPNVHTRSWNELSEETKNDWRKANGIRPVVIYSPDGEIDNWDELQAWDNEH